MIKRFQTGSLLALAVVLTVSDSPAAPAMLGVATARGGFLINQSPVEGNATVFEGTRIETRKASSSIHLSGGTTIGLAGESQAVVYRERLILERGRGELAGGPGYRMEALGLRIEPAAPGAAARVTLQNDQMVEVAALSGEVRVRTRAGFLVGNVTLSRTLLFGPQAAGAGAPSRMRGCVTEVDGKYYLTDVTSGVKAQVTGSGVEKEAGNEVEITGTLTADQVQVSSLQRLASGCKLTPGGAARGAGATAGRAAPAILAGVTIAVVGAGVGAYVAVQDDGRVPASR